MTQEERALVYKDICARLPYNVIVETVCPYIDCSTNTYETVYRTKRETLGGEDLDWFHEGNEEIKPYLRSEDDMTEEESEYLRHRFCFEWDGKSLVELINNHKIEICDSIAFVNWLYEHHFDPNGLIDNGLAYKAPAGMYNINK